MKIYFGCVLVLAASCLTTGCGRGDENSVVETPDAAMEQQMADDAAEFEKQMMEENGG